MTNTTESVTETVSFYNFYKDKSLFSQLIKVYGIGRLTAQRYILKLGLSSYTKVRELTSENIKKISEQLNMQEIVVPLTSFTSIRYVTHTNLRSANKRHIEFLKKQNSYVGKRLKKGLRVHGQRTRSTGRRHKTLVLVAKS